MAQRKETRDIVCKRCGVADREHDSAYDAIKSGWRLRRVGEAPSKDYEWLCLSCVQSERPPSASVGQAAPPLAVGRRSG